VNVCSAGGCGGGAYCCAAISVCESAVAEEVVEEAISGSIYLSHLFISSFYTKTIISIEN
jgi:hypothetical protein